MRGRKEGDERGSSRAKVDKSHTVISLIKLIFFIYKLRSFILCLHFTCGKNRFFSRFCILLFSREKKPVVKPWIYLLFPTYTSQFPIIGIYWIFVRMRDRKTTTTTTATKQKCTRFSFCYSPRPLLAFNCIRSSFRWTKNETRMHHHCWFISIDSAFAYASSLQCNCYWRHSYISFSSENP